MDQTLEYIEFPEQASLVVLQKQSHPDLKGGFYCC